MMPHNGSGNEAFISPQKVAVLMIINLYSHGVIDQAHIVPVMADVVGFLKDDCQNTTIEKIKGTLIADEDPTGETPLYTEFLVELWSLDALDDLEEFFLTTEARVVPDNVDLRYVSEATKNTKCMAASSLLGGFALDCVYAYAQLTFDQRCGLWNQFLSLREQTREEAELRHLNLSQELSPFYKKVAALTRNFAGFQNLEHDASRDFTATFDRFVEAKQKRDLPAAVSALHEAYDLAPHLPREDALFELAMTQESLGHQQDALKSAEEAIVIARRAANVRCIIKVVTWLCCRVKDYPDLRLSRTFGTKQQLWRYLENVSLDVGMPSIKAVVTVMGMLNDLEAGDKPAVVLEDLTKCLLVLPVIQNLHAEMELNFHVGQAAVWRRYGKGLLARCYTGIVNKLLESQRIKKDTLTYAMVKSCLLLQEGIDFGYTSKALEDLMAMQPHVVENSRALDYWRVTKLILRANALTKRLNLPAARDIVDLLKSLSGVDYVTKQCINFRELELLLAQKAFGKAHSLALSMCEECRKENVDVSYEARYLLIATRALLSFSPRTQRVRGVEALTFAQRALSKATAATHIPLVLEAKVVEARIYHLMGEHKMARTLCVEIIPQVSACMMPYLISEANTVYVSSIIELYHGGKLDRKSLLHAFNRAQHALNIYRDCDFVSLDRQLLDLRQEVMRELDLPLLHSVEDIDDADYRIQQLKQTVCIRPSYSRTQGNRALVREQKKLEAQRGPPPKRFKSSLFI